MRNLLTISRSLINIHWYWLGHRKGLEETENCQGSGSCSSEWLFKHNFKLIKRAKHTVLYKRRQKKKKERGCSLCLDLQETKSSWSQLWSSLLPWAREQDLMAMHLINQCYWEHYWTLVSSLPLCSTKKNFWKEKKPKQSVLGMEEKKKKASFGNRQNSWSILIQLSIYSINKEQSVSFQIFLKSQYIRQSEIPFQTSKILVFCHLFHKLIIFCLKTINVLCSYCAILEDYFWA